VVRFEWSTSIPTAGSIILAEWLFTASRKITVWVFLREVMICRDDLDVAFFKVQGRLQVTERGRAMLTPPGYSRLQSLSPSKSNTDPNGTYFLQAFRSPDHIDGFSASTLNQPG